MQICLRRKKSRGMCVFYITRGPPGQQSCSNKPERMEVAPVHNNLLWLPAVCFYCGGCITVECRFFIISLYREEKSFLMSMLASVE